MIGEALIDGSLRVGVGERDGIYFERGTGLDNTAFGYGNDTRRFFDSPEALVQTAFADIQTEVADQLDGVLRDYVAALDVSGEIDVARVEADFALISSGGALFEEVAEAAGQFEQQRDNINAVFEDATARLNELADSGINVAEVIDGLNQNLAETQQRLTDDFNRNIRDQYLAAADPGVFERIQLGRQRQDALDEALAVGGDVDQVNALFDALLEGLDDINQAGEDIADTTSRLSAFQSAASSVFGAADRLLTNPSLSPLSPGDRLAEAERQFNEAVRLASGGGTQEEQLAALSDLEGLTATYLDASRGFFASSEDYYDDFAAAESALRGVESLVQLEITIQQQQLDALNRIADSSGFGGAANDNTPSGFFGARPDVNRDLYNIVRSAGFDVPGGFGGGNFLNVAGGLPQSVQQDINDYLLGIGEGRLEFNSGGSATVRGRGGVDANLVPLALTNGESVSVSRADTMAAVGRELREVNAKLDRLTQVTAAGANANVGATREGTDVARQQARAARRSAAA
ncbi:MAG: hypothetical protein KI792_12655 [Alphaproteobacteria bacterium]|nr:hypothetical protein [Alphaproteobacteria bacterium SS10]